MNAERAHAFAALSTAASRYIDAKYAAAGQAPGSPAAVRRDDLHTSLVDRRVAHTLATGASVEDISPLGILILDANLLRARARAGQRVTT